MQNKNNSLDKIHIKTIVAGALGNNTYVINAINNSECIVIDPAGNGQKLLQYIRDNELQVKLILLTHGHYDHIESLNVIRAHSGAPVAIGKEDAQMLENPRSNLRDILANNDEIIQPAEQLISDGDIIRAAGLALKAHMTPGHTLGGGCYAVDNALFTGDTLFWNDVGRTDLMGGSPIELYYSMAKLFALPENYTCYPGHGPTTTLDHERNNSAFFHNFKLKY